MNPEEIDFFDRIAESWDANEFLSTPEVIKGIIARVGISSGSEVLDLGTGTGVLVPHLCEAVGPEGRITCIDISAGMLEKAKTKFGSYPGVSFILKDFERENVEGWYDTIFLYSVYPHLQHPRETLKKLLNDNLKSGGSIIIGFPTDNEFVNEIHKERKAPGDLLPGAAGLAKKLCEWGLDAKMESARNPYLVRIRK